MFGPGFRKNILRNKKTAQGRSGGKTYLNPSDEVLVKAGYEIKEEEIVTPPVTNESIKKQRQLAYRMRADQYLIAYQAYTELGEADKANEMKELWI